MEIEDRVDKTINHFKEGYNCTESILKGMDYEPNIATAFGAGLSRKGSVRTAKAVMWCNNRWDFGYKSEIW